MQSETKVGEKIYRLAGELFPIYRCLMGKGVRKTLDIIGDYLQENADIRMDIHNVPSRTKVFDWEIPQEWEVREAYIESEDGKRIIDIRDNNLHLMGYSTSINKWVDLEELKGYLYTIPEQPNAIPYVTSYYKKNMGFCMSQNQLDNLEEGKYHIVIDSSLYDGNLTYGEIFIPGESEKEIFFSTYICHPSMANNECSGPALMTEVINYVSHMRYRKYGYRFVYIPETIGAITYMSKNIDNMKKNIIAGVNLTCVGDDRDYSMVHTRYGNTLADRALCSILKEKEHFSEYTFLERGSDERQYNSPRADLPVVTFCRSKFHMYPEYHTSADNMNFVSAEGFQGSYDTIIQFIKLMEVNDYYVCAVYGEPQLGKRGLYPNVSMKGSSDGVKKMMDFIAYADGTNDLIDLAEITRLKISEMLDIFEKLCANDLLVVK